MNNIKTSKQHQTKPYDVISYCIFIYSSSWLNEELFSFFITYQELIPYLLHFIESIAINT